MDVLKDRKTIRDYAETKLSRQTLSNLLWAAWGINRPENDHRTAPSASNKQEVDVYVVLEEGTYLYEAKPHQLKLITTKDLRGDTGSQPFVKDAPLNLVFVADYAKLGRLAENWKRFYTAANTGYISQNIYLFCASSGLGTVVRGTVDREDLAQVMGLRPEQKVIMAQSVGYPRDRR